jgi:glutaredoxin-related protein
MGSCLSCCFHNYNSSTPDQLYTQNIDSMRLSQSPAQTEYHDDKDHDDKDHDDKDHDDTAHVQISKTRICVIPRSIVIVTTSLNTYRVSSFNSRRLRHLLDSKNTPYTEIDLSKSDVTPDNDHLKYVYRSYKEARDNIPVLYVDRAFIGHFDTVQVLEDSDELDDILYITLLKSAQDDHSDCINCGFNLDELEVDLLHNTDNTYSLYSSSGSIVHNMNDDIRAATICTNVGASNSEYGTFV